jgi:hypothetical protein
MVWPLLCLGSIMLTGSSASAWSTWETSTCKLLVDPEYIKKGENQKW